MERTNRRIFALLLGLLIALPSFALAEVPEHAVSDAIEPYAAEVGTLLLGDEPAGDPPPLSGQFTENIDDADSEGSAAPSEGPTCRLPKP